MTPIQFANEACSNYERGHCHGINILDDLRMVRFRPEGSPCLLSSAQACRFFEQCVLPLAQRHELAKRRQEYAEAAHQYRMTSAAHGMSVTRPCPQCGRSMEPRHRLCPACARDNHLRAQRKSMRDLRNGQCEQLTENGALVISDLQKLKMRGGMLIPSAPLALATA